MNISHNFLGKLRRMLDSNDPEENTPRQEIIMTKKVSELLNCNFLDIYAIIIMTVSLWIQGLLALQLKYAYFTKFAKDFTQSFKISDFNAENAPMRVGFEGGVKKNVLYKQTCSPLWGNFLNLISKVSGPLGKFVENFIQAIDVTRSFIEQFARVRRRKTQDRREREELQAIAIPRNNSFSFVNRSIKRNREIRPYLSFRIYKDTIAR